MDDYDVLNNILKIYYGQSQYSPGVKLLAKYGRIDTAVQIINCLLYEAEQIKEGSLRKRFLEKFKKKLLLDMLLVIK